MPELSGRERSPPGKLPALFSEGHCQRLDQDRTYDRDGATTNGISGLNESASFLRQYRRDPVKQACADFVAVDLIESALPF